jgi:hypothetical protein
MIFIDETAANTKVARLYGRAPEASELRADPASPDLVLRQAKPMRFVFRLARLKTINRARAHGAHDRKRK